MQFSKNQVFQFFTNQTIRLDEYLRMELPSVLEGESSNSKIRRLIVAGAVNVNGKTVVRPSFELRGKSRVTVTFESEKFFYEKQPDDIKFELTEKNVLFENENLIFINKPAMFPVEQTITGNRANLHDEVVRFLWNRNPELRNPPYVGIMHRLDKETSGVILFTKNRSVNKIVSDMFQNHSFEKKYYAVVQIKSSFSKASELTHGKTFTVEKFMGRISGKSQAGKWGSVPEAKGGQFSKTVFTVEKEIFVEGKKCFLLTCALFTGRTHQIRVHLSEAGFPILGDKLYGGAAASRMYLHACQLKKETGDLQFDVSAPVPWNI